MDDVAGRAVALPSMVRIGPAVTEAMVAAPRICGVRSLGGERMAVLIDAEDGRWEVNLPALVRGRVIINLAELVALEVERAIEREEVSDE